MWVELRSPLQLKALRHGRQTTRRGETTLQRRMLPLNCTRDRDSAKYKVVPNKNLARAGLIFFWNRAKFFFRTTLYLVIFSNLSDGQLRTHPFGP